MVSGNGVCSPFRGKIVDINGETLPYYHMEKQVTAMNMDSNLKPGLMF